MSHQFIKKAANLTVNSLPMISKIPYGISGTKIRKISYDITKCVVRHIFEEKLSSVYPHGLTEPAHENLRKKESLF